MIFMTRSTEAQIKKLLSNPLEETYNIEVPRMIETRSNPHLNTASTSQSAEKTTRRVNHYSTTSPLVKQLNPIQNKKLMTEKAIREAA